MKRAFAMKAILWKEIHLHDTRMALDPVCYNAIQNFDSPTIYISIDNHEYWAKERRRERDEELVIERQESTTTQID